MRLFPGTTACSALNSPQNGRRTAPRAADAAVRRRLGNADETCLALGLWRCPGAGNPHGERWTAQKAPGTPGL